MGYLNIPTLEDASSSWRLDEVWRLEPTGQELSDALAAEDAAGGFTQLARFISQQHGFEVGLDLADEDMTPEEYAAEYAEWAVADGEELDDLPLPQGVYTVPGLDAWARQLDDRFDPERDAQGKLTVQGVIDIIGARHNHIDVVGASVDAISGLIRDLNYRTHADARILTAHGRTYDAALQPQPDQRAALERLLLQEYRGFGPLAHAQQLQNFALRTQALYEWVQSYWTAAPSEWERDLDERYGPLTVVEGWWPTTAQYHQRIAQHISEIPAMRAQARLRATAGEHRRPRRHAGTRAYVTGPTRADARPLPGVVHGPARAPKPTGLVASARDGEVRSHIARYFDPRSGTITRRAVPAHVVLLSKPQHGFKPAGVTRGADGTMLPVPAYRKAYGPAEMRPGPINRIPASQTVNYFVQRCQATIARIERIVRYEGKQTFVAMEKDSKQLYGLTMALIGEANHARKVARQLIAEGRPAGDIDGLTIDKRTLAVISKLIGDDRRQRDGEPTLLPRMTPIDKLTVSQSRELDRQIQRKRYDQPTAYMKAMEVCSRQADRISVEPARQAPEMRLRRDRLKTWRNSLAEQLQAIREEA